MECRCGTYYEQRMLNQQFLRRAIELAESGKYFRVSQIRAAMGREGFSLRQLSQLGGKALSDLLKAKIASANPKKIKPQS